MRTGNQAVLWLQNKESCWCNHARDAVRPVDAFRLAVQGLPDGPYDVEWWETWKGQRVRTEQIEVRDENLPLTISVLAADTALKIRPK